MIATFCRAPSYLGAVAAVLFVVSTQGASALDCRKAKTPVETAICGDTKLKAEDDALSSLYFQTLRDLTGARHDLLIEDQRRWLKEYRTVGCEDEPSRLPRCLAKTLPARRQMIAACFAGRADASAPQCPIYLHAKCPVVIASVASSLLAYPWLVAKLTEEARQAGADGDCGPESADSPGTPDQNESSLTATLLAARANVVVVRTEQDAMWRGAAHPQHGEAVTAYDLQSHAAIPVTTLLPGLKPGSGLLAALSKAAEPTLDPSCCFDDTSFDHTFTGLGLETAQPIPGGWSVAPSGDLVLAYDYLALGRSFVATATVPRKLVQDAIAPAYAGVLVPGPVPPSAAP